MQYYASLVTLSIVSRSSGLATVTAIEWIMEGCLRLFSGLCRRTKSDDFFTLHRATFPCVGEKKARSRSTIPFLNLRSCASWEASQNYTLTRNCFLVMLTPWQLCTKEILGTAKFQAHKHHCKPFHQQCFPCKYLKNWKYFQSRDLGTEKIW